MEKKFRQNLILVSFGVLLFALVMNLGAVLGAVSELFGLVSSVAIGFLLAFILDVPMRGFEKLICRIATKTKKKKIPTQAMLRVFSLVLTLICLILVIVLVCTLVIPAVVDSVLSLYAVVVEKLPEWTAALAEYDINIDALTSWVNSLDLQSLIGKVSSGATSVISSVVAVVSSAVSSVATFAISFILAIYVLLAKHDLIRQSKRLMGSYMKKGVGEYLIHVFSLLSDTFSKFLSGQCVEAVILGFLIFLANFVCGVPYSALIGVLTGVMAFVPYVGAMAACVVGAFLVAIASPDKVIVCVIVYFVVQFVESQFIYPHVVGTSVGLSPLWTLVAVLIGGNLMGLFGMIFFIPIMAVALELLRENVRSREVKKCRAALNRI